MLFGGTVVQNYTTGDGGGGGGGRGGVTFG